MDQKDTLESYKVGESLPGNENKRSECPRTREAIGDDGSHVHGTHRQGRDLFGRSGCTQVVKTGAEFLNRPVFPAQEDWLVGRGCPRPSPSSSLLPTAPQARGSETKLSFQEGLH